MSSQFKSKAPKVSIYCDQEKRMNLLYGQKKSLKFKIKLNDEILDKNSRSKNNSIGKLQRGPNFSELKKSPSPVKQVDGRDLFNFKMVAKIGPQDYDPIKVHKKPRQVVIVKNSYTPEPMHTTASGNLVDHTDQPITSKDLNVNMIQFP